MRRVIRRSARSASLMAIFVAALAGCQPGARPPGTMPTMVFDRVADLAVGPAGNVELGFTGAGGYPVRSDARGEAGSETTSADEDDLVGGRAAAPGAAARGGSTGTQDGTAGQAHVNTSEYWVLPDGRVLPAAGVEVIALPSQAPGLWSYFASGRVPSTIEVGAAPLMALHPRKGARAILPGARAEVRGIIEPPLAGALVSYAGGQGLTNPVLAKTEADGSFRMSVPVAGGEDGLVVVRASAGRGIARVSLDPLTVADVRVSIVAQAAGPDSAPAVPSGLALAESAVVAVVEMEGGVIRAPLWSDDVAPFEAPPTYALAGAAIATAYVARSANGTSGSAVSGPPGGVPGFLAPPDLESLPEVISPGAELAWPPADGATLYTVRLTGTVDGAPLWEAAVREPRVIVPAQLPIATRTTLEVAAWEVAGVTTYSVAGLRALRMPGGVPGVLGRHSWATRTYGQAGKF